MNGGWYGNYGNPYAMFAAFKGLELMGYQTVSNLAVTPNSAVGDWYGSYADFLANPNTTVGIAAPMAYGPVTTHQNGDGSWNANFDWDKILVTAWYTDILQKTVFAPNDARCKLKSVYPKIKV